MKMILLTFGVLFSFCSFALSDLDKEISNQRSAVDIAKVASAILCAERISENGMSATVLGFSLPLELSMQLLNQALEAKSVFTESDLEKIREAKG